MKLKIAQVVGLNTDQKAAQVTSLTQDDNTFLGVIMLSSDDAFTLGRNVLSEISDFYFDFEGSSSEKLKAAFEVAGKKIPEGVKFDLLLSSVSGKVLYLISQGEMEVFLKREDKISSLLSVSAPSQLISGFLNEGDKLLLSTKSLINFLGADLEKSLNLAPEVFEEEIASRIGASILEDQGLAALNIEVEAESSEIPNLPAQHFTDEYPAESPKNLAGFQLNQLLNLAKKWTNYFPKSGTNRLILAVLLIIIISLGVGFKYFQSKTRQKDAQFNQALQKAKDDFNSAKSLSSINPTDAKAKLDSAKISLSQALSLKPNNNDAKKLNQQMAADSASILQQMSVFNFPVILDTELIKKNFRAKNISLSSGKILALDPVVKTLVIIDVAKKSNQILAGSDQLGDAQASSLNGGLAFVYSKDKGVIRVDSTNQKINTVSKKDSGWGEIPDIYSFAGNVYLLDTGKNMIWKYLPTSEGYSDKREYFSKGVKVDLTGSLRMQIESSIYVLKSGGEILRFTKGEKDNFSYSGLPSAVKNPKSFFVSSDTDNLYLLDSGNSRLLILTKTGEFKGQITGDKFAQATDLVVDEKDKKVYLLEGSKIYGVDLK